MAWELFYLCNYKEKAIIMVHIRKRNVSWKDGSGGRDVYVLFSTKLHNDSRSFLMTQESKRKQIIISLFWQILQCQKQQTWPCLLSVALFFFIVPFFSSLSELERRRRRRSKKVHWPENGLFVRPSETQTISKIGQLYPSFLLGFYAPFSKKTFFSLSTNLFSSLKCGLVDDLIVLCSSRMNKTMARLTLQNFSFIYLNNMCICLLARDRIISQKQ